MERADILVIGLGPAGASAAAEAARRGCRVVAVDRKREPGKPVQCAEFVPALLGMDVRRLATVVCQHIESMNTYVEDDAPDVQARFPGLMLDRAHFDALLVSDALSAGAQCRFGRRVRRFARNGCVEFSDRSRLIAPVIIGADGPRSLAGGAIGEANSAIVETRQITVRLHAPHPATDIFLSGDIPGGYGWLFPKGDLANLGAGVAPRCKGKLKDIVARLHRNLCAEGRVGAEVLSMTGGAIPVGGMLKPWGRLGDALVLLAGDAAGLAHPVTGAGIAAAVASGRLAGEMAAEALNGVSGRGEAYQDELESTYGLALERALRHRRALA
ncbi:MAG TPA: NAD(P)/FAD-dependent oxidoreductase, partial [Burkholderiales bacterium]|nr:NAD(P)/FAD-dependent oxidoreductase [Burkholderiales bacterium]